MSGDEMPSHPEKKRRQMPGVCPGTGDVEASIWLVPLGDVKGRVPGRSETSGSWSVFWIFEFGVKFIFFFVRFFEC